MNRSAEDGEWSSPHYGGEGTGVPPRRTKVCAGDTVGKNVSDSGRPGIVRRQGMAGIATLADETLPKFGTSPSEYSKTGKRPKAP